MINFTRFKSIWRRETVATDNAKSLITELYRGLLSREPDPAGLLANSRALNSGVALATLAKGIVSSDEFKKKQGYLCAPTIQLPNLVELHPQRYHRNIDGTSTFTARDDDDFNWLEQAIHDNHYYDSFGVWSPNIDRDKRVIAAFVEGLGARSCLELGCFTGPVLSLLDKKGIVVTGVEISHIAFVLAYPSIKSKIRYGDLLSIDLQASYDAVIAMDILEHLNPIKLGLYLARIGDLLARDGYCLINSPMFGPDDVFGLVSGAYMPEWRAAGPESFWRHLHCDAQGWPMHGHLIWASPDWWERQFEAHGLVRDREMERHAHASLDDFFEKSAPARKSFFLLRHADAGKASAETMTSVASAFSRALAM